MESGTRAPEQMAGQLALIAEDLMEQSRTNRELVVGLVRTEVDRAVGRVGFVREEELAAVRARGPARGPTARRRGKVGDLPVVSQVAGLAADSADAAEDAAERRGSAAAVARSAKTLTETTALRKMHLEHAAPEVTDLLREDGRAEARRQKPAAKKATAKKATAARSPAKTAAKKSAAKEDGSEEAGGRVARGLDPTGLDRPGAGPRRFCPGRVRACRQC